MTDMLQEFCYFRTRRRIHNPLHGERPEARSGIAAQGEGRAGGAPFAAGN